MCWCHEANCKQKSTGRGPQAVLERPRVWFPLLCPYLTVPAPYCTVSSSREWQKRGFSKKIGVSLGGAELCLAGADPLLTPLPLVHNPSGSQPQESSLAALWLSSWIFWPDGFLHLVWNWLKTIGFMLVALSLRGHWDGWEVATGSCQYQLSWAIFCSEVVLLCCKSSA